MQIVNDEVLYEVQISWTKNSIPKYILKGNSVFDKIELNEIKDEEIIIVLNLYTYGFMFFIIVILNLILMILKIKKKVIVLLSMK